MRAPEKENPAPPCSAGFSILARVELPATPITVTRRVVVAIVRTIIAIAIL